MNESTEVISRAVIDTASMPVMRKRRSLPPLTPSRILASILTALLAGAIVGNILIERSDGTVKQDPPVATTVIPDLSTEPEVKPERPMMNPVAPEQSSVAVTTAASEPTSKSKATPTPKPTAKPKPTVTPTPTPKPKPTVTPTPTPTTIAPIIPTPKD